MTLIRNADEADLPAIRDIYNAAVRDTTAIWNDVEVDLADRLDWFRQRRSVGFPVLVAERGGSIVGYAACGPFRPQFGYRTTVEHSVYVAEDARGGGIGRTLMLALMDRLGDAGQHVMVGAVDATNKASIALHLSLGFAEVGRMPQVGQKFGRWLDLVLLQRLLDDRPVP